MPLPGRTSTAAPATRSCALARNGAATTSLAEAAAARGIDLIVVSTNEVFDGRRTDGTGYAPDDADEPDQPVRRVEAGGRGRGARRLRVRGRRWRAGPAPARRSGSSGRRGCSDRPATTSRPRSSRPRTGRRLPASRSASCPTSTARRPRPTTSRRRSPELIGGAAIAGTHHLVNAGIASRADWARETLRQAGIDVATEDVPAATWPRASTPPAWAVLAPTALPGGEPMRPWPLALADRMPSLLRERSRPAPASR